MTYLAKHLNTRVTPQSEPIPGTVLNSAGGYSFAVDKWTQLDRFLILGTEGGTYYASEKKITQENARSVLACIAEDGPRVVSRTVEISVQGRAPKNDPALFVLAMASSATDEATRTAALAALPSVARIGTHLFHYLTFVQNFRGWGRSLRNAVSSWYTDRSDMSLATQLLKYQGRDGWSHRDVLRLAHPKAETLRQNAMLKHVATGLWTSEGLEESEAANWYAAGLQLLHEDNVKEVVRLIGEYRFPRELVPTKFMKTPEVWEALLPHMGLTAMIRNLGNMSDCKLLVPLSEASKFVAGKLTDAAALKAARVHPLSVLVARTHYQNRNPAETVMDALDSAFYLSFGAVTQTNKNYVLGIDISGSMRMGNIAGMEGVSPHIAAAVMAMVTARREPGYVIRGFHHEGLLDLGVTAKDTLDSAIAKTNRATFGGTDCSLPMRWALENKVQADVFAVYTDNETWAGKIHPVQALRQYRERTGIPAKLVVVGMVSNQFSIADPTDSGMLDIVGMDQATPELLAQFALGNV